MTRKRREKKFASRRKSLTLPPNIQGWLEEVTTAETNLGSQSAVMRAGLWLMKMASPRVRHMAVSASTLSPFGDARDVMQAQAQAEILKMALEELDQAQKEKRASQLRLTDDTE